MRQLSLNERRLIEAVATKGPLARTDLARLLGLTGATVTRMVGELDALSLFDEKPDRRGEGGQPKRLMRLRTGRFFAAGLTFSRQSLELAILDLAGPVLAHRSQSVPDRSVRYIAEAAATTLKKLIKEHAIDPDDVVGLGCAFPGNFGDQGEALKAHGVFSDFDNPDMMAQFRAAFDLPTWIENDGTSAAIGEHVYGRHPDDGSHLYFLHLGHGVGGGAVVDGRPFRGARGNACLPGFLFPYGTARPSGLDLLETLAVAGETARDFGDLAQLVGHSSHIESWVDRAGEQLATAVVAITAFIDPSVIVLGGRLPVTLNQCLVERIQKLNPTGRRADCPSRRSDPPPLGLREVRSVPHVFRSSTHFLEASISP